MPIHFTWGKIVSTYFKCTATSVNVILLESSEKQKSIEHSYKKDLAVVCSASAKLLTFCHYCKIRRMVNLTLLGVLVALAIYTHDSLACITNRLSDNFKQLENSCITNCNRLSDNFKQIEHCTLEK